MYVWARCSIFGLYVCSFVQQKILQLSHRDKKFFYRTFFSLFHKLQSRFYFFKFKLIFLTRTSSTARQRHAAVSIELDHISSLSPCLDWAVKRFQVDCIEDVWDDILVFKKSPCCCFPKIIDLTKILELARRTMLCFTFWWGARGLNFCHAVLDVLSLSGFHVLNKQNISVFSDDRNALALASAPFQLVSIFLTPLTSKRVLYFLQISLSNAMQWISARYN